MARVKTFKRERFTERVLSEVNSIFRTQLSDPRLRLVSATRVELSSDYSRAEIYLDSYDAEIKEQAKEAAARIAGKVRTGLARVLGVRHVPEIKFFVDTQYEAEKNIEQLLDS
ncbi:MAG: 30S ribosome-binding factor RbfA [Bdellovibrionales bacterium]|jgi:ribosome-binding factor A|nr:30S ribosome-binding factor RbfA [Bdellovibrionales bacterium]MBT3527332.1 30S ribosome-binding factor RbfA [Bdellovibrionales bacterium]MBT7669868.1 30S ribosome-binding factor RbfA [Bdellovibrionales bacterium]MBT7765516.1 30S ribosome-binding factor RbfA [Bdellovibrionales bacterium]